MFDEWDARPSSGTILFALKLGKVTAFVDSVKSFVAARDVAAASLTSLARAKSGHYVIGGENLKLRRFFEIACEEVGVPFTLRELGSLEEAPDPALREFCFNAEADSSRAQDELGYRPTLDVRAMIRAALEYFQKFKMLKREAR
jgi:nucleoside-diphosphate-sugar epimerase